MVDQMQEESRLQIEGNIIFTCSGFGTSGFKDSPKLVLLENNY